MKQIHRTAVITAIISTTIHTALAQEEAAIKTEELNDTTVIARRAIQPSTTTPSTLYNIEPDALKEIGITALTTALDQLPGVAISSSSQPGSIQGIRLRGLRPQDTQLRVDGVRFTRRLGNLDILVGNSPITGYSAVELLQGSQASLYGGNSSGGVVSLTTKKGTEGMKNRSFLEAGSFNSLSLGTEHGGITDKLSYFLSSTYQTSENDTYGDNSEADGFDNDSEIFNSALRLGYDLSNDLSLGLTLRQSRSEYETPQFGGSNTASEFNLGTLFFDFQVTDKLHSKLTLSHLMEDTEFGGSSGDSQTNYDQFGISLENAYQYSDAGVVSFGAEYENHDYAGFGTPNGRKDHYNAVYLNHGYDLDKLNIDTGLRFEDYQSFGSDLSWKAGAKYALNEKNTYLKGNIATGFTTPNFIQLFSPFAFGVAGNPNLTPETSLGWDLGIEQKINDHHRASVSLFQTDIEDAILANYGSGVYENTQGKTSASGIETAISGDFTDQIGYQLNHTWLDQSISGQPEQEVNAQLVFKPCDKLQFGFGAAYLDERTYGGNNLSDAVVLRAFGAYQLNDHVSLHGRIENLTDTEYSHLDFTSSFGPGDFPARRLGIHAGVTVEW